MRAFAIGLVLVGCGLDQHGAASESGGSAGAAGVIGAAGAGGSELDGAAGWPATGGSAGISSGGSDAALGGTAAVDASTGGSTGCGNHCTDLNATCVSSKCQCSWGWIESDGNPADDHATCVMDLVSSVQVTVGIDHTGVGDLVIKLIGPSGNTQTLVSRPGVAELNDSGSAYSPGDSSDLEKGKPISFGDGIGPSAESMGSTIDGSQVCCKDDLICAYTPDIGATASLQSLALTFNSRSATGTWKLCVGDAEPTHSGTLQYVKLSIGLGAYTLDKQTKTDLGLAIPDDGYPTSVICQEIIVP